MDTGPYQTRQGELLKLLGQLMAQTANAPGSGGVRAAAETLKALTGALDKHLQWERERFYPALMADPDPQVRDLAAERMGAMDGVRAALHAYAEHWTAAAIAADSSRFACATAVIGEAVRMGIERENADLHPLLARLPQVA